MPVDSTSSPQDGVRGAQGIEWEGEIGYNVNGLILLDLEERA